RSSRRTPRCGRRRARRRAAGDARRAPAHPSSTTPGDGTRLGESARRGQRPSMPCFTELEGKLLSLRAMEGGPPMKTLRAAAAWLALPALLAVIACSTNPATGHKQLNFYNQDQEVA